MELCRFSYLPIQGVYSAYYGYSLLQSLMLCQPRDANNRLDNLTLVRTPGQFTEQTKINCKVVNEDPA